MKKNGVSDSESDGMLDAESDEVYSDGDEGDEESWE